MDALVRGKVNVRLFTLMKGCREALLTTRSLAEGVVSVSVLCVLLPSRTVLATVVIFKDATPSDSCIALL